MLHGGRLALLPHARAPFASTAGGSHFRILSTEPVPNNVTSVRMGALALLVCIWVLADGATAYAEWYPKRPIYDYEKFDPDRGGDCTAVENVAADHGRCGPIDGPVFNSFINTPEYGDERSFLDGRPTESTSAGSYKNVVYLESRERDATLRVYINNDANENFGHKTTASGTRVRVDLPQGASEALRARAQISADNATPAEVEDTVDLVAPHKFRVEYLPGSARLLRGNKSYALPGDIVTTGTLVGNNDMNGIFPAGFEKAALIELRVKVVRVDDAGLAWWLIIVGSAAGSVMLAALVYGRTRSLVAAQGSSAWQTISADPLATQIVGGVVAAGIGASIALLIKSLLA